MPHPLLNLAVLALCGTIAGADSLKEIVPFAQDRCAWLSRFLDLSVGDPSQYKSGRVFAALDPLTLQRCLVAWVHPIDRRIISRANSTCATGAGFELMGQRLVRSRALSP
jgi:hypothetical protein